MLEMVYGREVEVPLSRLGEEFNSMLSDEVMEIILIKVLLGLASCVINISKSIKSVQNARSSGVTAFMLE
jgi:hypothetical protein